MIEFTETKFVESKDGKYILRYQFSEIESTKEST